MPSWLPNFPSCITAEWKAQKLCERLPSTLLTSTLLRSLHLPKPVFLSVKSRPLWNVANQQSNIPSRPTSLKPFKLAIYDENTNGKQLNTKIGIFNLPSSNSMTSHCIILPILLMRQYHMRPFDIDEMKLSEVILQQVNPAFSLKISKNVLIGHWSIRIELLMTRNM